MVESASTRADFVARWDGSRFFLLTGELAPFEFTFPPIDQLVDVLRNDEAPRILGGKPGPKIDYALIAGELRGLPLEVAMESRFQISHFQLSRFYGRGKLLDGFEEKVLVPWRELLREMGFTYSRCVPYIFISGKGCSMNYHLDASHVLAWQIAGTKVFHALADPERFAPLEHAVARSYREAAALPEGLRAEDVVSHVMRPGEVLFHHLLTPHWVDAGGEVAASVLVSHGGLRHHGRLSHREALLERRLLDFPAEREMSLRSTYSRPRETKGRRLLRTVLRVGDLDRSIAFYTGVLGMVLLRRRALPERKRTLAFLGYGPEDTSTVLELIHEEGIARYDPGTGYARATIGVEDVRAVCALARARGARVLRGPQPMKNGDATNAFVADPDGYSIELLETPEPIRPGG
jgi:lactoylglutathione lyase